MRADRLLSILLHLQVHRRLTTRELAQRLEVSERTIHRDMEALGTAGIPITSERGVGGGWSLLEDYRTDLTGLNEAEIQALFLTRPARLMADLGLHQASEAALVKLLAALPSINRRSAEYVRQRILVDNTGWHPTQEDLSALPVLQDAIWRERQLHFTYRSGDTTFERLVEPLGLVAKGSAWYLVAAIEDQIRNYRVSRISNAVILDQPATRSPGFDLAAYWQQSSAQFVSTLPRYFVTVRVAADTLPRIYSAGRIPRIEELTPPDTERRVTVRLQFQTEAEASGYLLSFGTQVEILEPQELREQVRRIAHEVAAFYDRLCQEPIS
ncbi:MAG: YafY family transcriptional regulator [Ktedonobacteraceae bacterium]|nr:YafY family transcriptional regulator [Ktedonobacteraceae bacterium]